MDTVCTEATSAYVMIEDTDQKAKLEEILNSLGCTLETPVDEPVDSIMNTMGSGGAGTTDPDREKQVNPDILISGTLCLLAIWLAEYHSSDAVKSASAIFLGFLFYCCAWAPEGWSPRDIIFDLTGEKLKSQYLWMLCDYTVGMYIASLAIDRWWGTALFVSLMIQVCFHIAKIYGYMTFETAASYVDAIFYLQLLVFFLLGGKKPWSDLFHRTVGSFRKVTFVL